ncbi:MAG: dTDP-4-dehydrorhamnose reductase [Shewanella sp.]|nr:dTDP-4-dehydrorhamnose reductase [Shewanella sp.]
MPTSKPPILILLTGASGQLGRELVALLTLDDGVELIGLSHQDLDITDSEAVLKKIVDLNPDVIINAAAFTDVEAAESLCELAHQINCTGAGNLANASNAIGAGLIHVSTDYVFDGKKLTAYCETDNTNPLNQYGLSKLAGEQAVESLCQKHIIIRSSSLFSATSKNFCRTMLQLGISRSSINVVSDQITGPTSALDLAHGVIVIAKEIVKWSMNSEKWGVYHFCGEPYGSWYELAEKVIQLQSTKVPLTPNLVIQPILAKNYQSEVIRPAFSRLDNRKIDNVFGIKPSNWQKALTEIDFKL